jgi:hypothetical protein
MLEAELRSSLDTAREPRIVEPTIRGRLAVDPLIAYCRRFSKIY